jgi:LPS export ABC transporter protein LptC
MKRRTITSFISSKYRGATDKTYDLIVDYPDEGITCKENEYIEFTKGVDMIFYDADGKESGHMKAKYAISYNKKEQMIARNNVELWNAEGKRLDTEELIWDQKSGRIHSEKFSKITSPTEVIYGDGFESDQDFSKYRIVNISGIVSVKNE